MKLIKKLNKLEIIFFYYIFYNKKMSSYLYSNPTFYISIISSIGFISSEILPFVPTTGNGIIHAILVCFSSISEKKDQINLNNLSDKIDKIYNLLNKNTNKVCNKNEIHNFEHIL